MVEDSESDAFLLTRALEKGGFSCSAVRVAGREAMEQALSNAVFDLILCDHAMPGFSAPAALQMVKEKNLDIPFIIVSGFIEEETAVAAMQAGAHDYVMKDHLARLVPAVERELREAHMRYAQRAYQEELKRAREELEERVDERTADLRAANRKLQQVLEERRQLENELLEIAENERRRIGFDLHDDLGQKLTGTSLMVKGLEQRLSREGHPCAADARKIHGLIDQVITHTHNLAHQCSSLNPTGQDLCAVLNSLTESVRKMFNVACEFTTNGVVPELPANTTLQLQKIAQEAVSNGIKHGKAANVAVRLTCRGRKLELSIRNDGVPFSKPPGPTTRMGLRIMNYRANTIGATLEITPEKDGTTVSCTLLLQNGELDRRNSSSTKRAQTPPETVAAQNS